MKTVKRRRHRFLGTKQPLHPSCEIVNHRTSKANNKQEEEKEGKEGEEE